MIDRNWKDSPLDLPNTVENVSSDEVYRKELANQFYGQKNHKYQNDEIDNDLYIWKTANTNTIGLLKNCGYKITEQKSLDDCIAYQAFRNNIKYAFFLYAFGQEKTTELDGEYCARHLNDAYSEDAIVIVIYVKIIKEICDDHYEYGYYGYSGKGSTIEFWRVAYVDYRPILLFQPQIEFENITKQLIYAFNNNNYSYLKYIMVSKNPSFIGVDSQGYSFNDACFGSLNRLHKEYGDMKIGYIRYNDVIYSRVPYIDGYGYFGFAVSNDLKVESIYARSFESEEYKIKEAIKTEETIETDPFGFIPKIVSVEPIIDSIEGYVIKLLFDNGEYKKYVLPIELQGKEVVKYEHYVFSKGIWNSVLINHNIQGSYFVGEGLEFKNGYYIPLINLYLDSETYSEPVIKDEIILNSKLVRITKKWTWDVAAIYPSPETKTYKVLVSGRAFNHCGKSTILDRNGHRLTTKLFDYLGPYSDDLALVGENGKGFGYIDTAGNLVIPFQYNCAEDFNSGVAKVKDSSTWFHIDKKGKAISQSNITASDKYEEIGDYYEGLARVSTFKLRFMDLAYHSDNSEVAGCWGFIDEKGIEVIPPQYIYAYDFQDGVALVAKGKWTKDKKWDYKGHIDKYWTDEELWGKIDKNGNEVIPCIYDEIAELWNDDTKMYFAHHGGWNEGKWYVIDSYGNKLSEQGFEDYDYNCTNRFICFYNENKWDSVNSLIGIYDLDNDVVLYEPQFTDVVFNDNDTITVEILIDGKRIQKVIDYDGNSLIDDNYSDIYYENNKYRVGKLCGNKLGYGLLDNNGKVLIPCQTKYQYSSFYNYPQNIKIYVDGKEGLESFDTSTIIPCEYDQIFNFDKNIIRCKNNDKFGLITSNGKTLIEPTYDEIRWVDSEQKLFLCQSGSTWSLMVIEIY